MESPFLDSLSSRDGFSMMIRNMKKEIEIFREANVPLFTEINTETQKYSQISGAMTVKIDGQEMTLQQASVLLMSTDRDEERVRLSQGAGAKAAGQSATR